MWTFQYDVAFLMCAVLCASIVAVFQYLPRLHAYPWARLVNTASDTTKPQDQLGSGRIYLACEAYFDALATSEAKNTGAEATKVPETSPANFSSLAAELRLKIYEYFTGPFELLIGVAPSKDSSKWQAHLRHKTGIQTTRSSLFLVSRLVSDEGRPLFYQDAVVFVNKENVVGLSLREFEAMSRSMARMRTWSIAYTPFATIDSPSLFDFCYLRRHAAYKTNSIRRLAFDASREDWRRDVVKPMNLIGVAQFANILGRNMDKLTSLEWVQVFGHLDGKTHVDIYYLDKPNALFHHIDWLFPRAQLCEATDQR